MYNRYMQQVQDVDDYIEVGRPPRPDSQEEPPRDPGRRPPPGPIPDRPPQMPPFYAPDGHRPPPRPEPPHPAPPPPPPPPPKPSILTSLLGGGLDGHDSLIGKLLGNFHMPSLELDDILLLLILFLVLRENGDDDLNLIIAALYVIGAVD